VKGTWVGNTWKPNDGKFYSDDQVASKLKKKCIAFIGDSLGRRLSATYAVILGYGTGSNRIENLKKAEAMGGHSTIIWKVNNVSCLHFHWAPRLHDLYNISCVHGIGPRYTDVIVAIGNHDAAYSSNAGRPYIRSEIGKSIRCLINRTSTSNPNGKTRRVYWRTAPNSYYENQEETTRVNNFLHTLNANASAACTSHEGCVVLDAATLLEPRSLGDNRIRGDTPHHYGSDARVAILQLHMHLIDMQLNTSLCDATT
jgi:hypothetical protein